MLLSVLSFVTFVTNQRFDSTRATQQGDAASQTTAHACASYR